MPDLSPLTSAQTTKVVGSSSAGVEQEYIGSTARRLWVEALNSPLPLSNVMYTLHKLLNGADDNLKLNGSIGTPLYGTWTPGVNETWFIESISIVLMDSGTTNPSNFGALGALANGVQIQIKSNGVTTTLATLNNNMDLTLVFKNQPVIPPTSGFFESSDGYIGELKFDTPILLQNSSADFVRLAIRDNLTGLDQFRVRVKAWKVN